MNDSQSDKPAANGQGQDASIEADLALQERLLPGVSRTFALTIPQLPDELRIVVTNAYLLCRLADTIEDEPELTAQQKQHYHEWFVDALGGRASAEEFAQSLHPLLSSHTLDAERDLVRRSPRVLRVTRSFRPEQRAALERCVRIMCTGMPQFQHNDGLEGLADLRELERYCYFVAGVVGEMLTDLFCDYSPAIKRKRARLMRLAVSFGQGLQMTNILKDMWEDRERRACWLPRDVFADAGCDLLTLSPRRAPAEFNRALDSLIGIAHACLRNALTYTQLIPGNEVGIRRFCLWAIGMAVLTLRKIHGNPDFRDGSEVKISRRAVKATILTTNLAARSNGALGAIFDYVARGLPLADEALVPASLANANGAAR